MQILTNVKKTKLLQFEMQNHWGVVRTSKIANNTDNIVAKSPQYKNEIPTKISLKKCQLNRSWKKTRFQYGWTQQHFNKYIHVSIYTYITYLYMYTSIKVIYALKPGLEKESNESARNIMEKKQSMKLRKITQFHHLTQKLCYKRILTFPQKGNEHTKKENMAKSGHCFPRPSIPSSDSCKNEAHSSQPEAKEEDGVDGFIHDQQKRRKKEKNEQRATTHLETIYTKLHEQEHGPPFQKALRIQK